MKETEAQPFQPKLPGYSEFIEVQKPIRNYEDPPKDRVVIKEMPSQEMLEDFLQGMSGPNRVIFNRDRGRFEWLVEEA